MKTKKSETKKGAKVAKLAKIKSPRSESKPKPKSVQSTERVCNRCKIHGITVAIKGHKCQTNECLCVKCLDYIEKNRRKYEKNKERKEQKKSALNKDKPKDNISFVNSLKNKSKKILNSKRKSNEMNVSGSASKKNIKVIRGTGKVNAVSSATSEAIKIYSPRNEVSHSPPPLMLQNVVTEPSFHDVGSNSSSTDVEINHSNDVETQPPPEKSSPELCAKYLRACEGLSRKLSKYKFSEDELIASLKYFIVRQSLGDIDRAANDIIFASQEIRLGASYIIQHPIDDRNTSQMQSTSGRQTEQPPVITSVPPQVLHSTMYPNYRPNEGHTYSPAFTPIRNN